MWSAKKFVIVKLKWLLRSMTNSPHFSFERSREVQLQSYSAMKILCDSVDIKFLRCICLFLFQVYIASSILLRKVWTQHSRLFIILRNGVAYSPPMTNKWMISFNQCACDNMKRKWAKMRWNLCLTARWKSLSSSTWYFIKQHTFSSLSFFLYREKLSSS